MKTKTFDCLRMKEAGTRRIYARTKDMTPAEELAYWRERGLKLEKRIENTKRNIARPTKKPTK